MFKLGEIIPRERVDEFVKELSYIDEEMLQLYTGIFKSFICKKLPLSELDYTRIDRDEEEELIETYTEGIENMPPIVTSPAFDGKRIVYDGCHRCVALENLLVKEVVALIPYETTDGRLVENMETNKPELKCNCKYSGCDKGKCCMCCEHNPECGGICSYCHEMGSLCNTISKNVSLFCDGIW